MTLVSRYNQRGRVTEANDFPLSRHKPVSSSLKFPNNRSNRFETVMSNLNHFKYYSIPEMFNLKEIDLKVLISLAVQIQQIATLV